MVFSSAVSEYRIGLVGLAIINSLIGIFYYLRVVIAMYFKQSQTEQTSIVVPAYFKLVLGFSAATIILLGVYPNCILDLF